MITDDDIFAATLKNEGGLVKNPADPGGITKHGITIPAATDYLRAISGDPTAVATPTMISNLTEEDAVEFFRWWMKVSRIGQIVNMEVRSDVFDMGIHSHYRQAIRFLQRALGLDDDGKIGPVTLAAIPVGDASKLRRLIHVEQMLFFSRLATKDLTDRDKDGIPDNLEFLGGWLNRLAVKMRAAA